MHVCNFKNNMKEAYEKYEEQTGKSAFYESTFDITETPDYILWLEKMAMSAWETSSVKGTVKIDDTTAFGCPHHNHNKHRVYINGLSHEEAIEAKRIIEKLIKQK